MESKQKAEWTLIPEPAVPQVEHPTKQDAQGRYRLNQSSLRGLGGIGIGCKIEVYQIDEEVCILSVLSSMTLIWSSIISKLLLPHTQCLAKVIHTV